MSTPVVFATVDRGAEIQSSLTNGNGSEFKNRIRRPTNGIVSKEETFATLTVRFLSEKGGLQTLVDAGSRLGLGTPEKRLTDVYANFLIQSVSQQRDEKQQILETFGDPYIFFYGQRARILQFQGVLLNSFDFNWRQEWLDNYENYLRGTKCVENDARVYLTYDDTLVSGYILNTSEAVSAETRDHVPFSFSLFVTGYSSINSPGNSYVLGSKGAQTIKGGPVLKNDPGRPVLISDSLGQNLNPFLVPTTGAAADASFYGNLAAGASALKSGFKKITSTINMVTKKISNMLNGTVVTVPNGFAGELVFYDDVYARMSSNSSLLQSMAVESSGTIKYTTFSANSAEYIGNSQQYDGARPSQWEGLQIDKHPSSGVTIGRARREWEAAGVTLPADLNPKLTQVITKKLSNITMAVASGALNGKTSMSDALFTAFSNSGQSTALLSSLSTSSSLQNATGKDVLKALVGGSVLNNTPTPPATTPIAVPVPRKFRPRLPTYAGG